MQMTGGEALARQLVREGARHVFAVPGVQLDWAVDALAGECERIAMIVPRHEQATTYMADGYARTSGRPGVAMVVPGPGVLNAMAGLVTAHACSSPVLLLAGQIPSAMIGRGLGMLHEIKQQSEILASASKWSALVRRPAEVPGVIREAFRQMTTGRPRPVVVEIPPDVLQAREDLDLVDPVAPEPRMTASPQLVAEAARRLSTARLPVIVAGGGAVASDASEALARLAERLQAPVVMTENGKGALLSGHPLALPSLGGRVLLAKADVVLVVGSRFLDEQGRPPALAAGASLIMLNIDPADAAAPRQAELLLVADAAAGLAQIAEAVPEVDRPSRAEAVARIMAWCTAQMAVVEPQASWLAAIRRAMPADAILVNELTQVGYFARVAFPTTAARSYLWPGTQGTLGYGFATAIGAAIANPHRAVVSINGDGGFGWTMQELATVARDQIPLITVVFRDEAFGNVKRIQTRTFGRTHGADLYNPDLLRLAGAFGIDGVRLSTPQSLEREISTRIAARRPVLIDVPVGAMPSAWHLIHAFLPPPSPPPPMPDIT